jgi:hypothetical protein
MGTIQRASPQLDIIVHNSMDYSPIFRSGEFVVVLPAAVVAIIEVKKRVTKRLLKDALKRMAEAKSQLAFWHPSSVDKVFSCIFAFSSALGSRKGTRYSEAYLDSYQEIYRMYAPVHVVPDLLMVADKLAFCRTGADAAFTSLFVYCCPVVTPDRRNIAAQVLLNWMHIKCALPERDAEIGRFSIPTELHPERVIVLDNPADQLR